MSSIAIIIIIIVLLSMLVCYAFIVQSLRQKREQRDRLLLALKARARNFHYMLDGFPQGFLPKDLTLLVQRSLQLVYEQMVRLEPKNASHRENMQTLAAKVAAAQKESDKPTVTVSVDNPQQSADIKLCLEELYKFVFQLERKGQLTQLQAEAYRAIIRQLLLHLTVDTYILHARIAQEKDKLQLACHYFELAIKLIQKEGQKSQFEPKLLQIMNAKGGLEKILSERGETRDPVPGEDSPPTPVGAEWDEFDKMSQSWKKKQLYD